MELRGLYDGLRATDGQVVAETAGLLRRAHGCTTSIIAGCSGSVHKKCCSMLRGSPLGGEWSCVAPEPRCLKYHSCHEAWRGLMLRFGLLICVCVFFLGCALLFAFGSAGSPCLQYIPSAVLFAAPIGLAGLIEVFLRQLVCTPYIYIF